MGALDSLLNRVLAPGSGVPKVIARSPGLRALLLVQCLGVACGAPTGSARPPPVAAEPPVARSRSATPTVLPTAVPTPAVTWTSTPLPTPIRGSLLAALPTTVLTPQAIGNANPVQAVVSFYRLLERGNFQGVVDLMSPQLRTASGWQPELLRDRTQSSQLTIMRAFLSGEADSQHAVVSVVVMEATGPPPFTRQRYVGEWKLVHEGDGWLLDAAELQMEDASD
jgi:hypothetical protein